MQQDPPEVCTSFTVGLCRPPCLNSMKEGHLTGAGGGGGGGDIACGGKYEATNSGATKSVPLLKNEQTNYGWFLIIAHEKQ